MLVFSGSPSLLPTACFWADQLSLLLTETPPPTGIYLLYDDQGLALAHADLPLINPVRVDFSAGAMAHRLQQGGGRGQALTKEIGRASCRERV